MAGRGRKDNKYFDSFVEMASYSIEAANYLKSVLQDFDPDKLEEQTKKMHDIEHSGDVARHKMVKMLAKEFITPIEREDIMELSDHIDDVTDRIEDVLLRLYMYNIREISEDAITMSDIIVRCTEAVSEALKEFHNFKKSKTINEKLIEINHLEEEADNVYTRAVRKVYSGNSDPFLASGWSHTLHYMENVCDACEDVSDVIENVIMKNS